jgi:16S rRNA C967 or C1407 C5-methylase (RsmB/RsmF family)/NOL1/NOP2/fmu family ribosome biogenesis protein
MPTFPESFENRMKKKLGGEWNAFVAAHDVPSPTSVRLNPLRPKLANEPREKILWTEYGYYLPERPVFTLDPLFHAGAYYVQEASSMFLEQAVRQHVIPQKKLRVLDLCAAPGGKSTHLLSLLDHDSLIVSNEVIRGRVNTLSENIQKWGAHNAVITNNDPADFSALRGLFDVIVLDAPCSGEGLFRKDPHAMNEWSEENVAICSRRQQRILDDVWPALKENGVLIYSTCTYNESEDEETLKWIAENHQAEFLRLNVNGWDIEEISFNNIYGYRFYPHRVKGEGFFISVMRKRGSESSFIVKPSKEGFASPEKRISEEVKGWLINPSEKIIQRNDLLQLLPDSHIEVIQFLSQRLRVVYAGTFLASVKHNKLVPEHALALSSQLKRGVFHETSLNPQEALQYLRKETLNMSDGRKGFSLATYNDVPIGWMNLLGGRINNLYPQEWRIRMRC